MLSKLMLLNLYFAKNYVWFICFSRIACVIVLFTIIDVAKRNTRTESAAKTTTTTMNVCYIKMVAIC